MWFLYEYVVSFCSGNSVDSQCVYSLLYIWLLCFGGNQRRNLFCFFFFFFFSLAYNTIVRFEDLKKLTPSEILASYSWIGIGKSLCLRVDFLLQVKELILLRQKLRSFLFFSLLLIIHYFCSYHFPLYHIIVDICLKISKNLEEENHSCDTYIDSGLK